MYTTILLSYAQANSFPQPLIIALSYVILHCDGAYHHY